MLRIDHFVHSCNCHSTHEIERKLDLILRKLEIIMATLDETLAVVTQESTVADSIIALLNGVEKQLADVLAGTVIPPPVQAKIDAIFNGVTDNSKKVSDAVVANTPAAATGA